MGHFVMKLMRPVVGCCLSLIVLVLLLTVLGAVLLGWSLARSNPQPSHSIRPPAPAQVGLLGPVLTWNEEVTL